MGTIWKVLTRKKVIDPVSAEETQLARRLNTFDLTALGVGSTLGVGVYVLAGQVATIAGPSVVLSFLIAAIASVFAGLCYAEFGARAPKAGSAYIYSYVCVGEFVAFIIGWNLILEYIIGSASVAKGLSLYLDNLLNNTLQSTFTEIAPIDLPYMAAYFDFFSCGISILLAIALAFGLKESSLANNIVTTLNIGVVLFVIVAGSIKADPANWEYQPNSTMNATVVGKGGFFPFGLEGTIKGAATCFYGFVGFDCIATTAEEVKNPKKAIPLSIVLSLLIIFLAYFGISTVVTLMVPYYLQDYNAPIPYAFEHIGWNWAKWVVSIGGIFGLCASLFGAMFPLPRIIYAMAIDSLVFKFLGRVSSRFQTPVIGTLLAGTLTGLMAAIFDLNQLVKMMSIGTLMAYTIVAASVLLLRFSMDDEVIYIPVRNRSDSEDSESYSDNIATFTVNNDSEDNELLSYEHSGGSSIIGQIFNCGRHSEPTKTSQSIVAVEVFLYCITCVLIGLSAIFLKHPISNGEIWAIVLASCFIFIAAILLMSIATQPVSRRELTFKVPMVPLIPALSILANIYLMMMLDFHTWIRFAVWMALGLPIYYFSLKPIDEQQTKLLPAHKSIENHISEKPNGLVNYYTNNGFVDDFGNGTESKQKKKAKAPLPPKIEEKIEAIEEIQQELEKFDEMLDEVANNFDKDDRKTSVGSVSVSDVVSREENVVADVHCDNVVTPAIPILSIHYPALNTNTEIIESAQVQTKEAPASQDDVSEDNIQAPRIKQEVTTPTDLNPPTPLKQFLNITKSSDSPTLLDRPLSFISISGSDQELVEASSFIVTPTPPPSINASPVLTPKTEKLVAIPLPPPLPVEELPTQNITPENKPPSEDKKNIREALPRVTSNKIKEVTLRPTKKKIEEPQEAQFEPDDNNLRISSNKTKSFMEKLNHKLIRTNMQPVYVAPIKKGPAPPPPKHEKNKNVIEESINRNEAKEKLGLFVNSRISFMEPAKNSKNDLEMPNKKEDETKDNEEEAYLATDKTEENKKDDYSATDKTEENKKDNYSATDKTEENKKAADKTEETKNGDYLATDKAEENEEEAYLAHQNRMKNVFRSMKSLDVSKEQPSSPSRNVKSLDHRPDEAKHKQAMSEIFKTIQLRRKESAQQQSKV